MFFIITISLFSGCFGGDDVVEDVIIEFGDDFRPYSVVAPIDTGINPYHNHFRSNETLPQWLIEGLGTTIICNLTMEGTYQERVDADQESCWSQITASDVAYFKGTRIFGTSPDWDSGTPILDDPNDGHGTAVTGAVLDADPDAIIFFVEGFSDNAVLAAANQPLVDILTTSFGAPGSVPAPGIEDATKVAVVENHKIHAGAADNSPSPAVQDATAGPPWSIGVSGYAEGDDDQKETMSGSYPDMASDWTQFLPNHQDVDEYHWTSGTSFATPRTAGFLAHVITSLREEYGDHGSGARDSALVNGSEIIFNHQIRDALNRSGWYPSASGWDPSSGTTPVSPILPCTQLGWGVLNWSNIDGMIAHLNGTSPIPDRPSDVRLCMQVNQESREAYWGVYPSESSLFSSPLMVAVESDGLEVEDDIAS
jgi:hypothetical protein